MQPVKSEVERCHADFKRIVPKGTSLNGFSQDDINEAFLNVAAIPRPQYFDKTSAELFIAIYGEEVFEMLGGVRVHPKDADLTPGYLDYTHFQVSVNTKNNNQEQLRGCS